MSIFVISIDCFIMIENGGHITCMVAISTREHWLNKLYEIKSSKDYCWNEPVRMFTRPL